MSATPAPASAHAAGTTGDPAHKPAGWPAPPATVVSPPPPGAEVLGPSPVSASSWLATVLANARNRALLARLEDRLVLFMENAGLDSLPFPPCSPFRRRVCMEVAQRFGLECRLDRPPSGADPDAVLLVLVKGPHSAVPPTLLSQLAPATAADGNSKPVLVKRPQPATRPTDTLRRAPSAAGQQANLAVGASTNGNCASSSIKKVSQEEYELARARIFKDASAGATNGSITASCDAPNPASSSGSIDGTKPSGVTPENRNGLSVNVKLVGGGMARGPEEGKSFARRRAQSAANGVSNGVVNNGNGAAVPKTKGVANGGGSNNNNSSGSTENADKSRTSGTDAHDPDFDRCYDKWAARHMQTAAHSAAAAPMHMHSVFGVPGLYPHGPTGAPPTTISHYAIHAHAHAAAAAAAAAYPMPPPPTLLPMFSGHMAPPQPHYYPPAQHQRQPTPQYAGARRLQNHGGTEQSESPPVEPQKLAPSYGLDSAADFPPLSVASSAPRAKQRR